MLLLPVPAAERALKPFFKEIVDLGHELYNGMPNLGGQPCRLLAARNLPRHPRDERRQGLRWKAA
jgi:hypothetical protein